MNMKTALKLFFASALAALSGCASFEAQQTMLFVDDDGRALQAEYARSEKYHTGSFIAPLTGEEMEFRTKLRVRVTLPDGTRFRAWQTMNMLPQGTMYRSDDERWMYHALGVVATVYERTEDKKDYKVVYEGVMCNAGNDVKRGRK